MRVGFNNPETGEVLKVWTANPSQEKFWNSKKKIVLFSGGYGSGKSLFLVLKAIEHALKFPNNFILMGRKTYPELRDTLWKEFPLTCPKELLAGEPMRGEMKVKFINGSEIIFRHLDAVAESEIRSMNLGAAFIDQAEDISRDVVMGLQGRLRREGVDDDYRQIYMTCNPKLTWLYTDFKQAPREEVELIECSTLENEKNLPKGYVESLLRYPESYKKQFVYGIWDEDLLSDRIVFAREYQEYLRTCAKNPIDIKEGLYIYEEYVPGHRYQMGIDASEGHIGGDQSAISIVDLDTLEEVASWAGRVPPAVTAEKAHDFLQFYQGKNDRCLVIPEMNTMGLVIVNEMREHDDVQMYRREEFDKTTGKKLEKYGWRTTSATKPLLISRFQEHLRVNRPRIYDRETVAQFRSFVYTDEAWKNGMGAEEGFHDDRVIALLLAFWEKGEVLPLKFFGGGYGAGYYVDAQGRKRFAPVGVQMAASYEDKPKLQIVAYKDGKARLSPMDEEWKRVSWLVH